MGRGWSARATGSELGADETWPAGTGRRPDAPWHPARIEDSDSAQNAQEGPRLHLCLEDMESRQERSERSTDPNVRTIYFNVPAPAWAHWPSCSLVPPEQPMAPTILP